MSKYLAKKTIVNGITFDSKKESTRYAELIALEKGNKIKDLKLQPEFVLQESFKKNGITYRKISYKADFQYYDNELKKIVVEDVKSKFTAKDKVFAIKKKLFEYKYPDLELSIHI